MGFIGIVLALIVVVVLVSCVKVVQQAQALVVERLGAYQATWGVGIHFKIPILERIARRVDLKEQVVDFAPQPVITKDNVTMRIDTVVFYQITDPKLFCYGVANPIMAIENLTATTLRNIIGDLELDQTLTSRETINTKMRASLDVATDPWGIKVNRVELKNIIPPTEIQNAMEKQMKAEREKREKLLEAEAHQAAVVKRAEGDKQAKILAAEADKEAEIARAKGKAESIRLVYEAEARGIQMLNEANMSENVLVLKKLDALKAVGDGRATKIVVPTELASSAANLEFVGEMLGLQGKDAIDKSPKVAPQEVKPDPCCEE